MTKKIVTIADVRKMRGRIVCSGTGRVCGYRGKVFLVRDAMAAKKAGKSVLIEFEYTPMAELILTVRDPNTNEIQTYDALTNKFNKGF